MSQLTTHPAAVKVGPVGRRRVLDDLGGLVPILTALALWAWVVAGVLGPLGGSLSRIQGPGEAPAPSTASTPGDALAAAPQPCAVAAP